VLRGVQKVGTYDSPSDGIGKEVQRASVHNALIEALATFLPILVQRSFADRDPHYKWYQRPLPFRPDKSIGHITAANFISMQYRMVCIYYYGYRPSALKDVLTTIS
jgi:hypothetical protein